VQEPQERGGRHDYPSPESHTRKIAALRGLVRAGAGDAEELAGALDGDDRFRGGIGEDWRLGHRRNLRRTVLHH
jgi:hypothetical protein